MISTSSLWTASSLQQAVDVPGWHTLEKVNSLGLKFSQPTGSDFGFGNDFFQIMICFLDVAFIILSQYSSKTHVFRNQLNVNMCATIF